MKETSNKIEILKIKYKIKECTVKLTDITANFYNLRASTRKTEANQRRSNRINKKSMIRLFKKRIIFN